MIQLLLKRLQFFAGWKVYQYRILIFLLLRHNLFAGPFRRLVKRKACQGESGDVMRLISRSIFGPAGKELRIPKDAMIYKYFECNGYWGLPTSYFIQELLRKKRVSVILDLGAHVGLVSLQAIKLNRNRGKVIAVEAIPKHHEYLVENFSHNNLVSFCGAVVGNSNSGAITMHVDFENLGNTSAFEALLASESKGENQVRVPIIDKNLVLSSIDKKPFVLKSDLQGFDASVLSSFDNDFWDLCVGGVVEVNAHSQISEDEVNVVVSLLSNYKYLSWSPFYSGHISAAEIRDFWLAGNEGERDLYFW
jgi:FkbM family methyltransferase